jgi:hypothetical protein
MKAYDLLAKASCNLRDYMGKKYKITDGAVIDINGKEYQEFRLDSECDICVEKCLKGYVSSITEVEEIPQAIPFMEAVKAYSEGKTIKCEIEVCDSKQVCTYNPKYNENHNYGHEFKTKIGTPVTTEEILRGVWFAEDSHE